MSQNLGATLSPFRSCTAQRTRSFAYLLPSQGVTVRFAESDSAEAIEKLIDSGTRAVFCESVAKSGREIYATWKAWQKWPHRHGVPLIVDNTVATPMLLRPIEYGADIVVHSLTKFMGRPWHDAGRGHCR